MKIPVAVSKPSRLGVSARDEPMKSRLLSIIIPTYNRREELCQCIESLLIQDYSPMEIIVVDDSSTDDTIEYLRTRYESVAVISNSRRHGPSHARNLGIIKARGEYLLFLDSDVVMPDQGLIGRMVDLLEQDTSIGEIGGEIPVYLGIKDAARGKFRDYFGKNKDVYSLKNDQVCPNPKECTYLATCNCMIRTTIAKSVGGFDPYYVFGGEDADFGYAIQKEGYRNLVDFSTGAHHYRSITGRYEDETFRYHYTRVRFHLKHFSWPRNLLVFISDFLLFLFFYVLFLPKVLVKVIRKETLTRENILGGYYLMKVYKDNLTNYDQIRRSRHTDFLAKEEMERFELYQKQKHIGL